MHSPTVVATLNRTPQDAADVKSYVIGPDSLADAMHSIDTVLHLAARNNDKDGELADFIKDNCEFTHDLYLAAVKAGVKTFIFVTTTHAIWPIRPSDYAKSKAAAEARLRDAEQPECKIIFVRLPAVWGQGATGKLGMISTCPPAIRPIVHSALRSLQPIAGVTHVINTIAGIVENPQAPDEVMISDPIGRFSPYHIFSLALHLALIVAVATVLLPFLLCAAVIVKLTSKGPAIFAQERVGYQKSVFKCLKFRTMYRDTANAASHEVGADQITRVGHILRKTKLDELPQAWNILRGEMRLIGPRPGLPAQHELSASRAARGIYDMKPGITGLAQVQQIDMSTPERLALEDYRYHHTRSIVTDIKILIATVLGRGAGDAAQKR